MLDIFDNKIYKLLTIATVSLSLAVCVISFVSALQWIDKPFPGFLFYRNLVVTDIPYKVNKRVGLKRFSDKIIEINRKKVSSPSDIFRAVNSLPVGTIIDYRVFRNGEFINLSIPTMRFTVGDFIWIFGVIYFIGFILLIVGTFVYYLKPQLHSSRIFFFFCSSIGIWFVTSFSAQTTYLLGNLAFLGGLFSPAFAIYLAFIFPSESLLKWRDYYIAFLFALSSFLFTLNTVYFDSYVIWKNINTSIWLYIILGSLSLPASSLITYLKGTSALERQKAQVILLGSSFGLFLPALGAIGVTVFKIDIPYNLLALPVIIFIISVAYAIVKHSLFDIDAIVKKTLLYSILTGVLGGIFILMVIAFNVVFASYGGWRNPVFFIILTIFVVIALNPLKNQIQNFIDLTFFRKRYDYRRTIEEISSAMTSLLDLDEIATKIITSIERTMFLNSVSIILWNENSGNYEVYATSGTASAINSHVIKENSCLVALLKRYKKEVLKEDLIADEKYIEYRDKLMGAFSDFNAALFIPLFFKGRLIGVLSLGEKKSGLLYTSEDIRLLKTLANQSAIAIENAIAYRMVEDYAKRLERANKELRETQSQLIQAEKMSAIGQLAAGIAHEIRNPLNIIEGARYYLSQVINGEGSTAGEYLNYIKHEVERTNRLIDNLLRFSRAEPPHFELLDINSVLENALILVRKQLSDNHIKLITNFDVSIPSIVGDLNQLWQVFINIIINAIQAMSPGGELRIDTGLASGNSDCVLIKFTDTGIGIDEEDIPKIFNPFFTKKDTGTGLGLSISYKIVEEHRGRILVSSEKGKGTTFMVELPISYSGNIGVEDDGEQKSLSS